MDIEKESPAIEAACQRTCRSCLEKNLIEEVFLARCTKCNLIFCSHSSSNIDPQFCVECLSDITLHKEVITKTYEYENAEGEVVEYKRKARQIRLEGNSWLFIQRKIVDMSDVSLELAIEYHREILSGMLSEREHRKAAYLHRYANVKTVYPTKVDSATSTSTEVKKSKTISSTRVASTANAMMQALLAQGWTIEKITEMIEKMGKK